MTISYRVGILVAMVFSTKKYVVSLLILLNFIVPQGALFAVEDVGKVWFSPNKGGDDFLNLFTDEGAWNNARTNVDVFQFYYQNLNDDNPALCAPRCGNVVYPNLVLAGAFTKLNEWNMDIAVLVPVIKEWTGGCSAARPIEITLRAMDRVAQQNEQVDFLTMDEPFNDGRTGCQRTGDSGRRASIEQTVDYIAGVRARYPHLKVGDTEPFPVNSAQSIIIWIDELENRLRERGQPGLAFFRLDVNRAYTGVNYEQGIAQIKAHCALRNIPFSIIYWGDLLNFTPVSNQEYYTNTYNWLSRVKTNNLAGDHHVFNSWHVDEQGVSRVPINLPENDPVIYSHTRLIREGLAVLLDNNAQFVSQHVPPVMDAGGDYQVSITFRNSGSEPWEQKRNYKLGSQTPQDNSIWGFGRVSLGIGETVLPGAEKTFTFTVRAPATAGSYNFQWKMNHEGVEWFGAPSNNSVVNVRSAPSQYLLSVVSGSGSGSYAAGTVVNISANAPPVGQEFDRWVGAVVGNATSANTTLTMPSVATTVTATYRAIPPTTYQLTVVSGSGSGSYAAGTVVNISANAPPVGQEFDRWVGAVVGNATSANTTLTMPSVATTVTATYRAIPPTTYQLTVVSGSGSGSYAAGTVVNISANAPPVGQEFDRWVGAVVGNATSANTTLTMPSVATTVTATYRELSSNGNTENLNVGVFGAFNRVFKPAQGEILQVRYNVFRRNRIKLTLYNRMGHEIAQLFHGEQEIGSHQIQWNGVDEQGQMVPTGMYFLIYEEEGGSKPHRTKIILLK